MIIWEGPGFDGRPVVAIATGYERPSANRKTGDMIQLWILPRDTAPSAAVRTGADKAVCGTCPLRGIRGVGRACYVRVAEAPDTVWRTYRAGGYPRLGERFGTLDVGRMRAQARAERRFWEKLTRRGIRFGAYGDAAVLPYEIVARLAVRARVATGYTHAWRTCDQRFRRLLMASTESAVDAFIARAAGWRPFRVGADEGIPFEIECPSARGTQCVDCGLCDGTSVGDLRASIRIPPHGTGARYALPVLQVRAGTKMEFEAES